MTSVLGRTLLCSVVLAIVLLAFWGGGQPRTELIQDPPQSTEVRDEAGQKPLTVSPNERGRVAAEYSVAAQANNELQEPNPSTEKLREGFSVFGSVANLEGGVGATLPTIIIRKELGTIRTTLSSIAVPESGQWGPVELSAVEGASYVVRLEGGGLITEEKSIAQQVGQAAEVNFVGKPGLQLMVRVVNAEGAGIDGATVVVSWQADKQWTTQKTETVQDGGARMEGCPPGTVWVSARSSGFVASEPLQSFIPNQEGVLSILLTRAGQISGRCLSEGIPVRQFSITYWVDPTEYHVLEIRDSEDGSFVIDACPLGEIALFASSNDRPRGGVVTAVVSETEPSIVELSLGEEARAHGRVIDGLTGESLQEVHVQVIDSFEGALMNPRGPRISVDQAGRFELHSLGVGSNFCELTSSGYATTFLEIRAAEEEDTDLGVIALSPLRGLEIRLLTTSKTDLTEYWATGYGASDLDHAQFSSEGRVRYDQITPGEYWIQILFPDGLQQQVKTLLLPGKGEFLEVRLDGRNNLSFEVVSQEGHPMPSETVLGLIYDQPSGHQNKRFVVVPPGKTGTAYVPCSQDLIVEAYDQEWNIVATKLVEIVDGGPNEIQVRIGGPEHHFRILDQNSKPLHGVDIILSTPLGQGYWYTHERSDKNGECSFRGLGASRALIVLRSLTRGTLTDIEVDLQQTDEVITLQLPPGSDLTLGVVNISGSGLPGVGVGLFARESGVHVGDRFTDERGMAIWSNLNTGEYTAKIDQLRVWPTSETISHQGNSSVHTLTVPQLGNLSFQVSGERGPIEDAIVTAVNLANGESLRHWLDTSQVFSSNDSRLTDEGGGLHIYGVPSGRYSWRVETPGGLVREGEVVVPAERSASVHAEF